MDKKLIGAWGERVARKYLEEKGYKILETNWRFHHKELDIIAYNKGVIGFEIKTRTSYTDLAFTVLRPKQVACLRQALNAYCRLHCLKYQNAKLSLLIIKIKTEDTIGITHYRDI